MHAIEAPVNNTVAYVQDLGTGETGRVMVWTASHEHDDHHESEHDSGEHTDTHADDHTGEGH